MQSGKVIEPNVLAVLEVPVTGRLLVLVFETSESRICQARVDLSCERLNRFFKHCCCIITKSWAWTVVVKERAA